MGSNVVAGDDAATTSATSFPFAVAVAVETTLAAAFATPVISSRERKLEDGSIQCRRVTLLVPLVTTARDEWIC